MLTENYPFTINCSLGEMKWSSKYFQLASTEFNKYFTSVGEFTTYKANPITREYGLDKECGSRKESIHWPTR